MRYEKSFMAVCLLLGTFLLVGNGCMKKEQAIVLPPVDTALYHNELSLGENYEKQVFFNMEENKVVFTSAFDMWDLAFESDADGYHIFMNGGKDVQMMRVSNRSYSALTAQSEIAGTWGFDSPTGLLDSTYVGDWRVNSNINNPDLYLVRLGKDTIMKVLFRKVTTAGYTIEYGALEDEQSKSIFIPKKAGYSLVYFSFQQGGMVTHPDPPANTFQLKFTRYKHIYYELGNFPYLVNGTMLNCDNISAAIDSTHAFADISLDIANQHSFSKARNVIGFDWKIYDFNQQKYVVRPNYIYLIKDEALGKVWKLRFVSFYNQYGIKGCPAFEFKQLK